MRRVTPFFALCTIVLLGCAKKETPRRWGGSGFRRRSGRGARGRAGDGRSRQHHGSRCGRQMEGQGCADWLRQHILTMVLDATGDPSTWTFNFPGQPPVPVKVTMDGDSIMTSAGPYPSAVRKGVKVSTNGVIRLLDDKLVGHSTAHYQVSTADSVLDLSLLGVRAP